MSTPIQMTASSLQALQRIADDYLLGTRCSPARTSTLSYSFQILAFAECVAAELAMDVSCRARSLDGSQSQSSWLITWQLSGTSRVQLSRQKVELSAGTWMISDPAERTTLHSSDQARLLGLNVPRPDRPAWNATAAALRGRGMVSSGSIQAVAAHLLALLRSGVVLDEPSQVIVREAVLALLERAMALEVQSMSLPLRRQSLPSLQSVQRWIGSHLQEVDLSAKSAARAFDISRRTLYNLFDATGNTPRAYIQQCRLEEAARLLGEPAWQHLTVAMIGQQCGFISASHFARSFLEAKGMSPLRWRERAAQGNPESCTPSQLSCTHSRRSSSVDT